MTAATTQIDLLNARLVTLLEPRLSEDVSIEVTNSEEAEFPFVILVKELPDDVEVWVNVYMELTPEGGLKCWDIELDGARMDRERSLDNSSLEVCAQMALESFDAHVARVLSEDSFTIFDD